LIYLGNIESTDNWWNYGFKDYQKTGIMYNSGTTYAINGSILTVVCDYYNRTIIPPTEQYVNYGNPQFNYTYIGSYSFEFIVGVR
jgi:hypothetical protein